MANGVHVCRQRPVRGGVKGQSSDGVLGHIKAAAIGKQPFVAVKLAGDKEASAKGLMPLASSGETSEAATTRARSGCGSYSLVLSMKGNGWSIRP